MMCCIGLEFVILEYRHLNPSLPYPTRSWRSYPIRLILVGTEILKNHDFFWVGGRGRCPADAGPAGAKDAATLLAPVTLGQRGNGYFYTQCSEQ